MASRKVGTDVAMEELTIAHEGIEVDPAAPAAVDGADFLVWQRNLGSRAAASEGDTDGADLLALHGQGGSELPAMALPLSGDIDPATAAGDFDGDGDVDGRDFLVWQRHTGGDAPSGLTLSGDVDPSTALAGDANADGDVDGRDFLVWQRGIGVAGDFNGDGHVDGKDLVVSPGEGALGFSSGQDSRMDYVRLAPDDDGPSTLMDLGRTGENALQTPIEAPELDFDADVDFDVDF